MKAPTPFWQRVSVRPTRRIRCALDTRECLPGRRRSAAMPSLSSLSPPSKEHDRSGPRVAPAENGLRPSQTRAEKQVGRRRMPSLSLAQSRKHIGSQRAHGPTRKQQGGACAARPRRASEAFHFRATLVPAAQLLVSSLHRRRARFPHRRQEVKKTGQHTRAIIPNILDRKDSSSSSSPSSPSSSSASS